MYKNICDNYVRILERITKAAKNSGRDPNEIHLVVATKTQPIEAIQALVEAGATDFGENYVEEAIPKITRVMSDQTIKWHMIGHVQSRKAAQVCEYFQYLHSLDSLKLAIKLARSAVALNVSLPAILEFNVGGEESKSGWDIQSDENWDDILFDLEKVIELPGLNLLGAMTIPPYSPNPEESKPYYQRLRKFQEIMIKRFTLSSFTDLSIGMSSDFEIAIQEGATWVRIGQAIFGPRNH
jgi:pyridoxal phosphate enzyme (YggS family)